MKFMMLHAVDESTVPETKDGGAGEALTAWVDEMTARGVALDGARLYPVSDATTVRRAADGAPVVTDGPFAETKEQVAGYDVIDCPDLDAAVAVAAAHPTTLKGSIEVRAFEPGMPDPEVSEAVADGKRRYLMLVCADMRQAMAATEQDTEQDTEEDTQQDTVQDTVQDAPDLPSDSVPDVENGDDPMGIDAWVDSVADRRLYGWPLAFPDTAVTVRRVDGRVVTIDGPFAETKEQVAGYDLLECADLDEALAAATTHPVAGGGVIELRPLWP